MVKVHIIESESWFGQKIDEIKEFPDEESAREFCSDYNNRYNPPSEIVPDWYMYARLEDQKEYGMIR